MDQEEIICCKCTEYAPVTTPHSCTEGSPALTDGHRATIQLPGNMKAAFCSSSAACQIKPPKSKVPAHVAFQATANACAFPEPQRSSRSASWLQVKAFIIRSHPSKGLCVYIARCTRGSLAQGWHAEMPQISTRLPFV